MARRQAHRKGAESRRQRILRRDQIDGGWICVWCERFIASPREIHIDHVVPAIKAVNELGWSEAEANDDSNCAVSCKRCNESRGDRLGPPRFLVERVPLPPTARRSLSPVPGTQGSLWDLSGGGDNGRA